jgi:ATP-dependent Clp protease ATP-binding subunit ClpA
LVWNAKVLDFLVAKGFSKKLGARPLQRTIEQKVGVQIARMLAKDPGLSDQTLTLHVIGDGIQIILSR